MTQWNMNGLEFLAAPGVALGGTPIVCLFIVTVLLWGWAALTPKARSASVKPAAESAKRPELGIALRTVQKTPAS